MCREGRLFAEGYRRMKFKAVSGIMLALLFLSFLAGIYRAETESEDTRVYVNPPLISARPGNTFSIDVVLADVTNLYSWEFKLFWDNSILNCTDEDLLIPEALNWEDPNNIKLGPGIEQDYNGTHGRWYRGFSALPVSEPYPIAFTGTMELATLTFKVLDAGETTIDLENTKVADPDAQPISHEDEDGYFSSFEHDIAVFLEAPWDVVPEESVLLNATVANFGLNEETDVELHLLINGSIVDSTVVSLLQAGSSYTLGYLWTPIVEASFNVTAYAFPVPDEEYTTNNVKSQMVIVYFDAIYVRADGRVAPSIAPISTVDNVTYTFTDNIYYEIVLERDSIVVDGTGYILQGPGSGTGIDMTERSNVTLKNMEMKGWFLCIRLKASSNNSIAGNNITNNNYGVSLGSSSHNSIIGNNITENPDNGIVLWESSDNTVSGNNITNNGCGIRLDWSSDYNKVSGNDITSNFDGVVLLGSSNNRFCHNHFIDNSQQVSVDHEFTNVWDDGYPSGGNYWDDYNGTDSYSGRDQNMTGKDRIGDTPYIINEFNRDRYPLIYPCGYGPCADLNEDGSVDILDVILGCYAFGSCRGQPRWNPISDLNEDGIIDIFDLILIVRNFGKTA